MVGTLDPTTMNRNRNGNSLGTALEIQLMVAIRRGRRSGTTAINVQQAKNREPGIAAMNTHYYGRSSVHY